MAELDTNTIILVIHVSFIAPFIHSLPDHSLSFGFDDHLLYFLWQLLKESMDI